MITDEMLDAAVKEFEAAKQITEALRQAAPERRLNILRAACILATGCDLDELDLDGAAVMLTDLPLRLGGQIKEIHGHVPILSHVCTCIEPDLTTDGRCNKCGELRRM